MTRLAYSITLLVAALTATAPGHAAPSPERAAALLAGVLAYGDAHFDPGTPEQPVNLVRDWSGQVWAAQDSIEYAAALLLTGQDPDRAAAIVHAVLAGQCLKGGPPAYGNFRWQPGDLEATPGKPVLNVVPWLAYLMIEQGDRLSPELKASVAQALTAAARAVDGGEQDPFRTRAFLMRTAATAMIGRALDEAGRQQKAAELLQQWTADLERNGLGEYDSPSCTTESIAALQWVWQYAPTEAERQQADTGLRYLYADLLQHYHPQSGFVGGAHRVAVPLDYQTGLGPDSYLRYGLYGSPDLGAQIPPFALFLVVQRYEPPAELVAAGLPAAEPRLVRSRSGPITETATYVTPQYSLGTMTGWVMDDCLPLLVTYAGRPRPTAYFVASPAPAWVTSLQSGSRALLSFHFDQMGLPGRHEALLAGSLGPRAAVDEVWADVTPLLDTDPATPDIDYTVALNELAVVATRRGDVYTAFMVLQCGAVRDERTGRPAEPTAELGWEGQGPTAELRLRLYAERPEPLARVLDNMRVGLMVEVATRAEYPTMADFAKHMYAARARYATTQRRVPKQAESPAERERGFPLGPLMGTRPKEEPGGKRVLEQTVSWWHGDDSLVLQEDLNNQEVLGRWINQQPFTFTALYRSPLLNQEPGDPLTSVFRPPPPEPVPAPPAPTTPEAPAQPEEPTGTAPPPAQ